MIENHPLNYLRDFIWQVSQAKETVGVTYNNHPDILNGKGLCCVSFKNTTLKALCSLLTSCDLYLYPENTL